jgi:hypothetical protein
MGLDMYLHAKRYVSQFVEADKALAEVIKAERVPGLGDMRLKYLTCEALYWRKANAIHAWFVRTVQDNEDDCGEYSVDREQLADLMKTCFDVVEDPTRANELLPPSDGFFFGSTEVDQGYLDELKWTAEQIEMLLVNPDLMEWDFTYQSSW